MGNSLHFVEGTRPAADRFTGDIAINEDDLMHLLVIYSERIANDLEILRTGKDDNLRVIEHLQGQLDWATRQLALINGEV